VLKELNESEEWIDMLVGRKMIDEQSILPIQEQCRSLCRIIAASVRTAKKNLGRIAEAE
jgi:hypothetical protein